VLSHACTQAARGQYGFEGLRYFDLPPHCQPGSRLTILLLEPGCFPRPLQYTYVCTHILDFAHSLTLSAPRTHAHTHTAHSHACSRGTVTFQELRYRHTRQGEPRLVYWHSCHLLYPSIPNPRTEPRVPGLLFQAAPRPHHLRTAIARTCHHQLRELHHDVHCLIIDSAVIRHPPERIGEELSGASTTRCTRHPRHPVHAPACTH
jgi:hypothetical protein